MKRILIGMFAVMMAMPVMAEDPEPGDKTTTSQPYVKTQVDLKQGLIPAAGTNNALGDTVVTYTANGEGEIGERGIYTGANGYDASTDADKLITASALNTAFTTLPTTNTTTLECANPGTCTLWTIVDQTAYGETITLPAGYTRLAYIESTGTQYIDTGLKANLNTKIEMDFALIRTDTGNSNLGIYGAASAQNQSAFTMTTNATRQYIFPMFDSVSRTTVANLNFVLGQRYHIVHSKDGWYYDGTLGATWSGAQAFTTPSNILVFASNGGASGASGIITSASRIYYAKIYDNGTLVRDFIPVSRDNNGSTEYGMYDIVNNRFYQKQGTSDFIAGPELN